VIHLEHVLVALALVLGLGGGFLLARARLHRRGGGRPEAVHQILLPFTAPRSPAAPSTPRCAWPAPSTPP